MTIKRTFNAFIYFNLLPTNNTEILSEVIKRRKRKAQLSFDPNYEKHFFEIKNIISSEEDYLLTKREDSLFPDEDDVEFFLNRI